MYYSDTILIPLFNKTMDQMLNNFITHWISAVPRLAAHDTLVDCADLVRVGLVLLDIEVVQPMLFDSKGSMIEQVEYSCDGPEIEVSA
ncbi:hypothetical protein JZU61_04315 [bacterium]|nr:hypothetical protein [bacterium]